MWVYIRILMLNSVLLQSYVVMAAKRDLVHIIKISRKEHQS